VGINTLEHKVAIVTGGNSGIGRATAIALFRTGADVVVVGRNDQRIKETLSTLHEEGKERTCGREPLGLSLDVRKEADMNEMVLKTVNTYGRVDILVAAAGTGGSRATMRGVPYAVVQLPTDEWDEVIDTNLKGIFLSNRAVLPVMMKQGLGDIVNISSSRGATLGNPFAAAYSASKHGVMGLSEALAEEVRSYGIRVQVLLPDVTDTPMLHLKGNLAPYGLLKPEMVANLIIYLLTLPDDTILDAPLMTPFANLEKGNKVG
jgi:NAD(P)-dependent dehydrogenase (short-subunit alcohol dehydrogenase family)